ncbi:MAG: LysR substrate-binding domain-containing protein [Casimicrobiaceae bacterium]
MPNQFRIRVGHVDEAQHAEHFQTPAIRVVHHEQRSLAITHHVTRRDVLAVAAKVGESDLRLGQIDAGVRIGRLPDSSLVAMPVGQTRRVLCASPAYLKRAGTPRSPAELASHRCVTAGGLQSTLEWTFAEGTVVSRLPVSPVFASNQIETALDACLRGIGLGQFLLYTRCATCSSVGI